MPAQNLRTAFIILLISAVIGCVSSLEQRAESKPSKYLITDQTGRKWDISHAVSAFRMKPKYFKFGIGAGAIPSVDDPVVIENSHPSFPLPDQVFGVFGVDHNGRRRAYPVSSLTRHEVYNDIYPVDADRYVSVAY